MPVIASSLAALAAPSAAAGGRAASWTALYTDSDHVTIVSPRVTGQATVAGSVDVDAGFELDVITAASVDVVTAASPRGFREVRQGAQLGAALRPVRGISALLRYLPSWEPDYRSHALAAAASAEWLEGRLTTQLGYRLALDQVGRSGAAEAWRPMSTHAASVEVAWVFDRFTVGTLIYEAQRVDGFQASPYRYVRIPWGATVPESVPDERGRHAVSARVRRALTPAWFAGASYRFYADTWSVQSHTAEAELAWSRPDDRVTAGVSVRGYRQGAAWFYEERYQAPPGLLPRYRTADRLLTESWSLLAAGRVELGVGPLGPVREVRLTAKVEAYAQRFIRFAPLTDREALVASLGLAAEF